MTDQIKSTASKLLADIRVVSRAWDDCASAINRVKTKYSDYWLQIHPTIPFATWAYFKFSGDWGAFESYTCLAIDNYSGRGISANDKTDKSQLWVWETPDRQEPLSEVSRLFDRIDIAMHLVAKELSMSPPVSTVVDHGYSARETLSRIESFATGLCDVLEVPCE